MFYDDKSKGVIDSGKTLALREVDENEEVVFKASFYILGDLKCITKVTALFDLIVLGNIECTDIEVKGKLICLGNCVVKDSIDVQNELWANDVRAAKIICHDKIVVQEMDVDRVVADGDIVVAKTLAVEERAETFRKIMCGDTAYGAGRLVANTIITTEPLDMDDGEESIENPYSFKPKNGSGELLETLQAFVVRDDFYGFLDTLLNSKNDSYRESLDRARRVYEVMSHIYPGRIPEYTDISIILWLIEMARSEVFVIWPQIPKWLAAMVEHFDNLIHGKESMMGEPKPAHTLEEGYVVSHEKYGRGVVKKLSEAKLGKYVYVDFDEYGEKQFPIPNSLKFFRILRESQGNSATGLKESITCSICGYEEWVAAFTVLNSSKTILGNDLYETINDMLLAKIGLKAKFINDRLKERGWDDV